MREKVPPAVRREEPKKMRHLRSHKKTHTNAKFK